MKLEDEGNQCTEYVLSPNASVVRASGGGGNRRARSDSEVDVARYGGLGLGIGTGTWDPAEAGDTRSRNGFGSFFV